MDFETVIMQLVIGLIAFVANLFSALAGGGAGLVQLPALILLGLPFSIALATHKIASVALGLGAGLRHAQEKNLKLGLVLFILGFGLPGVWLGARMALSIPSELGTASLGFFTACLGIYSVQRPNLGTPRTSIDLDLFRGLIG